MEDSGYIDLPTSSMWLVNWSFLGQRWWHKLTRTFVILGIFLLLAVGYGHVNCEKDLW